MLDAVHGVEPGLLTMPRFYGSAGEPTLGNLPNVGSGSPYMGMHGNSGINPMLLGLLASAGMMPSSAQAPVQAQLPKPDEVPNDSPVDVMPDYLKFGPAFAKAKHMGLDVFTWRGNTYTTKLK